MRIDPDGGGWGKSRNRSGWMFSYANSRGPPLAAVSQNFQRVCVYIHTYCMCIEFSIWFFGHFCRKKKEINWNVTGQRVDLSPSLFWPSAPSMSPFSLSAPFIWMQIDASDVTYTLHSTRSDWNLLLRRFQFWSLYHENYSIKNLGYSLDYLSNFLQNWSYLVMSGTFFSLSIKVQSRSVQTTLDWLPHHCLRVRTILLLLFCWNGATSRRNSNVFDRRNRAGFRARFGALKFELFSANLSLRYSTLFSLSLFRCSLLRLRGAISYSIISHASSV